VSRFGPPFINARFRGKGGKFHLQRIARDDPRAATGTGRANDIFSFGPSIRLKYAFIVVSIVLAVRIRGGLTYPPRDRARFAWKSGKLFQKNAQEGVIRPPDTPDVAAINDRAL
jgi:hypothetical protein